MKQSAALLTLLASLAAADITRLFSNPPQPTPNESPIPNLTILTIKPTGNEASNPAGGSETGIASATGTDATTGGGGGSGPSTSSSMISGTGSRAVTTTMAPTGSTATTGNGVSTTQPAESGTGSNTGTQPSGSGASGSQTASPTSNPAAMRTAFADNIVAGVIALAGLAVAL